jgi:hypothetical protein
MHSDTNAPNKKLDEAVFQEAVLIRLIDTMDTVHHIAAQLDDLAARLARLESERLP